MSHCFHEHVDEVINERFMHVKVSAVSRCPSQDAPQYITPAFIRRHCSIRNSKSQCPDVVCNYIHRGLDFLTGVIFICNINQLINEGEKYIGFVIRSLILKNSYQTFKAHTCVHMPFRKRMQLPLTVTIILNKNQVPELYYFRVPGVNII